MQWWQLILALLVITGYVIKHILAAQEQQKAAGQRAWVKEALKPAEPAQSDEEVAGAQTALDRRIEQAIEARRDLDGEEPVASPVPRRSIPMAAVVVRPVPRYQPPAAERDQPQPVRLPRSERPRVVRLAPAKQAVQRAAAPAPAASPPPDAASAPAVRQVLELLKNRQSLAAAVLLHEILDRPRSWRRRRI